MKAIVFFAQGLEECEGLLVVDILRRAGIEVDIAAVGDSLDIVSSHNVQIRCDILARTASPSGYDAAILPGGMPGSANLEASEVVKDFCSAMDAEEKLVCAICAAPSVLASFGLLEGEDASVYPGMQEKLEAGGAHCTGSAVTKVGNHITGEALGAAIPFALEIVAALLGQDKAVEISNAIVWRG